MDPLQSKAAKQMASSASGAKKGARKAAREKKRRATAEQNAGQPSAAERSALKTGKHSEGRQERPAEEPATGAPEEGGWGRKSCGRCCGRSSAGDSPCDRFLALFGLQKRKKVDDFVVFDNNASMEQSLLWSKDGGQPDADDYLEFVPEHERDLAERTANQDLPRPEEDTYDY